MTDANLKAEICDALAAWVAQRPAFTTAHGANVRRDIARDRRDAEILLNVVRETEAITAEHLQKAFKSAFSGRLRCIINSRFPSKQLEHVLIEHAATPYWTTEYRKAVIAVLAYALSEEVTTNSTTTIEPSEVRSHFRKRLGSRLQRRWFNQPRDVK